MTVWMIYECRRGYDVVVDCCATEAFAEDLCRDLLRVHPRSDGYYSVPMEVRADPAGVHQCKTLEEIKRCPTCSIP